MKNYLLILLIAPVILSSCLHTKKTVRKRQILDTLEVTARADDYVYRSSATRVWDITHTRVALSFNWLEKTADGQAWVDMHPYFYPTDSIVLDAKSMQIDTVFMCNKSSNRILNYSYKNDIITVRFEKAWRSADTVQLYIRYIAMPYAEPSGGSAAITEDRGLYFINTDYSVAGKPAQIWTQGETESNSHWLPTIDKPNTRFTTQIELTVPDSMETLSNGYLAKNTKEKNGLRTDVWKMDMPIQAYVAMFAIGRFSIIKDQWRGKDVNYYVEPAYAPYARKMFNNTPEMIEYFSKVTGVPYPWNKYDQVVVRDYVSGAMENTSATLLGEFLNQNAREIADKNYEDVVSHELFHQWFGDYVTCESWSNLTLNESFANYGEQLWREYKYGKTAVEKLAYDDLQQYLFSAENSDPPLVRFYYKDKENMFDRTTYQKGGAILNYMRRIMGDEAFSKAMSIYLSKNALHSAEATQWRLAVEEATGQDWNWFFNEWYYHGGHPVLNIKYVYDDSAQQLCVKIKQAQEDTSFVYQLPLKAAIIYGNDGKQADWDIRKRKETFCYPYKNGIRPLIIPDATHVLVGAIKENKTDEQWLQQFKVSDDYINKRIALTAVFNDISDSSSQTITDLALNDSMSFIRELALTMVNNKWKTGYKQSNLRSRVKDIAYYDKSNEVRSAAFNLWGDMQKHSQGTSSLGDMINKSFTEEVSPFVWDSSYNIAGAALGAIAGVDTEAAYGLAKQILPTRPCGALFNEVWAIIGRKANDEDISLFRKAWPYYYGTKKFYFNNGLYTYLQKVKDDGSFEKGLMVVTSLTSNENIKSYRLALGTTLVNLGRYYKPKTETGTTEEMQQSKERYELIRDYVQKIISAEKDPENVKQYNKMYKELGTVSQ